MAEGTTYKSHFKEYMIIFVVLTVLTAIEIAVPEFDMSKFKIGSALVFLAVGKAVLVAYYFMHLNEEKPWLKFIAAIPISAAVYTAVVCLESMYR